MFHNSLLKRLELSKEKLSFLAKLGFGEKKLLRSFPHQQKKKPERYSFHIGKPFPYSRIGLERLPLLS